MGDAILIFSVLDRRLTKANETQHKPAASASQAMGGRMRGMGGSRGVRMPQSSGAAAGEDDSAARKAYTISASVYSIRCHGSFQVAAMSYTGPDIDAALREFARRLRSSFSGNTCTGWNQDAPIAIDRIQRLLDRPLETPREDQ